MELKRRRFSAAYGYMPEPAEDCKPAWRTEYKGSWCSTGGDSRISAWDPTVKTTNPCGEIKIDHSAMEMQTLNQLIDANIKQSARIADLEAALTELRDFAITESAKLENWKGWPREFMLEVAEHCGATLDDEVEK